MLLSLLMSNLAMAQDTASAEEDQYISTIKAQEVENQISETDVFKTCKEDEANDTPKKVEDCIKSKYDEIDPDEFADKMDLKSYDRNATKDSKSIREYLNKRIQKAVYGVDPDEAKMKAAKIADHALYAKLYRSQIGKNILMEVSNYCLSNLGFKDDPYAVVNHCVMKHAVKDKNGKLKYDASGNVSKVPSQSCAKLNTSIQSSNGKKYGGGALYPNTISFAQNEGYEDKGIKRIFKSDSFTTYTSTKPDDIWKELTEYTISDDCKEKDGNYCAKYVVKPDGTRGLVKVRNTSFLDSVKELEFKLGPEYMKNKYSFCSFTAIKNMCEVYRCQNVYDSKTKDADKEKVDYCMDVLNIQAQNKYQDPYPATHTPLTDPTNPKSAGLIACSVVERLKEYRKVIEGLDKIDENNKGLIAQKGFDKSMYKPGFYGSGNKDGEKSVEEITTISSSEISENVKLGLSEEEAKELREECIDAASGSLLQEEKCKALLSDLDDEGEKQVIAEVEAETQAYLKRLEAMKDDDESIKEYLIKNGLSKYIDRVGEDNDLLAKLIADEYKSQRAALKKSMMDKYNRIKEEKNAAGASAGPSIEEQEGQIAEESISNLEKQKERIQTLFQYNNVISSYMSAELGDGEDAEKTDLSYIRQYELEGMNEFGNEDTKAKYDEYSKTLQGDDDRSASGNEQMSVDLGFIDSLLGNN